MGMSVEFHPASAQDYLSVGHATFPPNEENKTHGFELVTVQADGQLINVYLTKKQWDFFARSIRELHAHPEKGFKQLKVPAKEPTPLKLYKPRKVAKVAP